MAYRDYRQDNRTYDREYDSRSFDRDRDDRWRGERDDLWERERNDRYEGDYGRRFSGRRSSIDWDDQNRRMAEYRNRGQQRGEFSARDFDTDDDYDYAGDDRYGSRTSRQFMQHRADMGYARGQRGGNEYDAYDSRGFGFGEHSRSWGGAAGGYGPSTGYGYGTAGRYLGGPENVPSRRYSQQNYVGRGPRGYKRSDDRIREEINERLTQHPEIDASDVEVRVVNCEVTLSGVVEDRRAKRLAEDIAEEVWGIDDMKNELKIRRGFLASLTGEQADDREVARTTSREGSVTGARGRQSGSTPGMSAAPSGSGPT